MSRLLCLFVSLAALAWATVAVAEDPRRIVVTGEGSVQVIPDMAVVTLGVTAQSVDAQTAMDAVSEDVRAIFQTMIDLGIAPRDVQTTTLRLDPVFANRDRSEQGPPEIRGFIATNDVAVRVRDMTALGTILQAVLDSGANRFSSIQFTLSDPGPSEAAARRAAVADAQARAALYADAAGVALGPVLSIVEGGTSRPQPMLSTARMAMEAVPVAGGELEITARVTLTYGID